MGVNIRASYRPVRLLAQARAPPVVHKQWKEGQSEGVSRWLFVGQIAASVGFTLYSFLVCPLAHRSRSGAPGLRGFLPDDQSGTM